MLNSAVHSAFFSNSESAASSSAAVNLTASAARAKNASNDSPLNIEVSASAVDDEDANELPTDTLTMQKLFERLHRQPNFPALQIAVRGVQRVVRNGSARLQNLAAVVMGDPAITHRMLRLSNAAYYRGVGGGSISSVERAIALMGFDAVQQMAVCAHLLDSLPRDAAGLALREDYLRALLAAHLAQTLCMQPAHADEAYITALYQNLGRMVVSVHLGAEAVAIRTATPHDKWPLSAIEQRLSQQHLGVSYARLGAQLARRWGWPEPLRAAMRHADWPLHASPSEDANANANYNSNSNAKPGAGLRWLGRAANELADLLLYQAPDSWPAACQQLAALAGPSTGQTALSLMEALAGVRGHLEALAASVGLSVSQLPQWRRADADADADANTAKAKAAAASPALTDEELLACTALPAPPPAAKRNSAKLTEPTMPATPQALAAAPGNGSHRKIDEVSQLAAVEPEQVPAHVAALASDPVPELQRPTPAALLWLAEHSRVLGEALLRDDAHHAVPREALRMLWKALGARRAVLHLNAPDGQGFLPVQALGEPMASGHGEAWRVDPARGRDLFSRLCAAATDSLIEDAHRPKIAKYLPSAFVEGINARRFLVLPIVARGRSLGMIYLDRADHEPFMIDDSAMQLVRSVRNQAAVALV